MPNTPSDRPSIAEIAAFTRRLRELSQRGRDVDPAEREQFLADKRALLDRITTAANADAEDDAAAAAADEADDDDASDVGQERHVHDAVLNRALAQDVDQDAARYADHLDLDPDPWGDYRTYTSTEAAAELIAHGVAPEQAPGMVERYVEAMTWDRGWSPQDQWQLDDGDLAEMTNPPDDDKPAVAETWAPPGGNAHIREVARAADAELEHRAQLARWDDPAESLADVDDDAQTRVIEAGHPLSGQEPTP